MYEFTGPREQIEKQIEHSLKDGTHRWPKLVTLSMSSHREIVVRVATLGQFPEVLYEGYPGQEKVTNAEGRETDTEPETNKEE